VTIDLNADVGEIEGEEALYALVTSVNVACGGHAGDSVSMTLAVQRAALHGVSVGAHPSYPDREHFGRRSLDLAVPELARSLAAQIAALAAICRSEHVSLVHVKPHGALYHDASARAGIADAVADAVATIDPRLHLVGLAGSAALASWAARGLRTWAEGFVDRAYEPDGSLRARQREGALILDPSRAAEQAVRLARSGVVETLCVHGDTPGAATLLRRVRSALAEAGIELAARGGASR
jgi:UPF0271 protein